MLFAKYMGFSETGDVIGYLGAFRPRSHQCYGAFNLLSHNSGLVVSQSRSIDAEAGSVKSPARYSL